MKPIKFKESNITFAKDQPQYKQLPAFKNGDTITSCWKLSIRERFRIIITGKLWISQMNFNSPLQPILPTTKKKIVIK